MDESEPGPNNPLGPYFPSDVPDVPGNARRWFVVLMVLLLLAGAVGGLLSLLPF
jgi:hypothetical protein